MLKINGNEVTYTKSFLLERGEEAILSGPELSNETLRLSSFEYMAGMSSKADVRAELVDGAVALRMPFLDKGSFATTLQLELNNKSTMKLRIAGMGVGGNLLVQLDVYLSRPVNFAPR